MGWLGVVVVLLVGVLGLGGGCFVWLSAYPDPFQCPTLLTAAITWPILALTRYIKKVVPFCK